MTTKQNSQLATIHDDLLGKITGGNISQVLRQTARQSDGQTTQTSETSLPAGTGGTMPTDASAQMLGAQIPAEMPATELPAAGGLGGKVAKFRQKMAEVRALTDALDLL